MLDRRTFLLKGAAAASAVVPLQACLGRVSVGTPLSRVAGYGPLRPVRDRTTQLPLLLLPGGFSYVSFGWTGDALLDQTPTPPLHDGMACFAAGPDRVRLVRNHEIPRGDGAFAPALAYDPVAGGGTTTVEFDTRRGRLLRASASLAGTIRNCAGGATPWGSWLTCEEAVAEPAPDSPLRKTHGWVFEVPTEARAVAEPLRAMGCFVHEAVAVDPATGIVYETEDQGEAGFYRFIPRERGRLAAGGSLEMLAVKGRPRLDTRKGQPSGTTYAVEWVRIDDPERAHHDQTKQDKHGVFTQGHQQGGAIFARLEGAWHGEGRIYFVATSGGDAERGQVWEYEPAAERLRLVFESPGADVLDMPDNLCVSPRGGLVLSEDGEDLQLVRGLTTDGQIFDFAQNNVVLHGERGFSGDYRRSEIAGVTFSPDGNWLFFNIQTPGITIAVTGPWKRGAL
ncbi:MAG: DUF839 domain-containing protein [Luteitalea sp.]|nr:DUF839 domain-containing protein [Luteitalea sp.]